MPLTADQVPPPSEDATLKGPVVQVADKETLQKRLESYYAGIDRMDLLEAYNEAYLSVAGKSMKARQLLVEVFSAQRAPEMERKIPRLKRDDEETFKLLCNFFADESEGRQAREVLLRIIRHQEDIWYGVSRKVLQARIDEGKPLRLLHYSELPDDLKVED
ncbi:hypothetical protein VFPPC_18017 [Pochonia chlamydosporia 170]|uniref:Uncharacterized protein n=1 Tax=Pochonia chlamydosporia 170 TaxID=1380566 RepID=A0A219AQA2_METCM|nr:hypothetical protein VFPPC_18017 [Pochonia chlamydosporia 170]OWT42762.1 hypothetical protein VFPPC_18017 [Pochonia chlamydosporia 170]